MDKEQVTALLDAAARGEVETVTALLDSGVSINSANDIGFTALMSAAKAYRSRMVSFLLSRGADPRMSCPDGLTALHVANGEPSAPEAQRDCVRMLLEAGAEKNAQTRTGLSPLMNAAWFGCLLSAKELLHHGADPSITNRQGLTAEVIARKRKHLDVSELIGGKRP